MIAEDVLEIWRMLSQTYVSSRLIFVSVPGEDEEKEEALRRSR